MPTDHQGQAVKAAYLRLPRTVDRYRFRTMWLLAAPLRPVWSSILDSHRWPQWWPGVVHVTEMRPGNADGVGDVRRYVWRSRLPYTLEFDVRIEPMSRIEGIATGEVKGVGIWHLVEEGDNTRVEYHWDVRTTPIWMRVLAPIAKPLIRRNHDVVMEAGGDGLARYLGVRLLRNESETLG